MPAKPRKATKAPNLKLVSLPPPEIPISHRQKEAEEYEPTERQRRFHDVAVRCMVAGKVHPSMWMNEHYEQFNERVSAAEFDRWKVNKSFTRWFYADLRYTPDENDLAVADAVFMQTIIKGVSAGDARALEIYANIRGFRKRPTGANEADGTEVDKAIDAFVKSPTAAGWDAVKK